MEQQRSEAVVLRKVAYREADLILTLYTRDLGKISALARAARRSRRRFGAALELFTVSEVELGGHRSELWTLQSADIRTSFTDLARDVAQLAHASYATELVRELSAAEQSEPGLFDLLIEMWRSLATRGARTDVLRAFELALLGELGLAPALAACAGCGSTDPTVLDRGALLDPARGGVVCAACAPASRTTWVKPLGAGARALLAAAQDRAGAGLTAVDLAASADDAAEARDAMLALLHHQIGHPLRTLEFLDKLRADPRPPPAA